MKPFRLFTAFHANLDFSALPENDRPTVLARCYWPLLSLPERLGIRMGFELSARTLEILMAEDPEWVKRFIGLVENGLVEPIGSLLEDRVLKRTICNQCLRPLLLADQFFFSVKKKHFGE